MTAENKDVARQQKPDQPQPSYSYERAQPEKGGSTRRWDGSSWAGATFGGGATQNYERER